MLDAAQLLRCHYAAQLLVVLAAAACASARNERPAPMPESAPNSPALAEVVEDASFVPGVRASRVLRNARIYTGKPDGDLAGAMAIGGDKVLFVGDVAGAMAYVGPETVVHDLGGRLVIPGLHDVHQHTLEAHLPVIDCILDPAELDPEAYLLVVADCRESADTGWVLGWGHSILTLDDATRDPRLILDEAFSEIPVAIMEETSHSTWVNSKALALLGITADTPDPQGGLIVHNESGQPNGVLIDSAGELPWEEALAPTEALRTLNADALRAGMADNAKYGITSAVDARVYVERGYLDAYEALEKAGGLTTRMVLSLWASPLEDDAEQIARLKPLFRDDGGWLRVRQVKFYSDGLLQNTTAALLAPYAIADTYGPPTGLNYFPEARLEEYLGVLQSVGFDAHIHAIGDRAVREAIDAIVATRSAPGGAAARHRLTHVELTDPEDAPRFAKAGVPLDMQLGPYTELKELSGTAEFIGKQRTAERAWVLGDLWRSGAVVALSSDFDVNPLNPFPAMARALERGEQSLPDVQAVVRAYTLNGAFIMHSEDRTGTLDTGKLADFVVLDRDLFESTPTEIAQTKVLWTVVGGEEVYRRAGFEP